MHGCASVAGGDRVSAWPHTRRMETSGASSSSPAPSRYNRWKPRGRTPSGSPPRDRLHHMQRRSKQAPLRHQARHQRTRQMAAASYDDTPISQAHHHAALVGTPEHGPPRRVYPSSLTASSGCTPPTRRGQATITAVGRRQAPLDLAAVAAGLARPPSGAARRGPVVAHRSGARWRLGGATWWWRRCMSSVARSRGRAVKVSTLTAAFVLGGMPLFPTGSSRAGGQAADWAAVLQLGYHAWATLAVWRGW